MSTHKSRTSAYQPLCDGLVERQNRIIQDMLSAFFFQHRDDWDTWVRVIAYAYNSSTHKVTGFSSYELVFGRTASTPIEIDLEIPRENLCSQSEYSQSVRRSLRSLKQSAQQNLAAIRPQQKRYHDQHLKEWVPLSVDSSVWLRSPKPWKFGWWIGPFRVISRKGVNYTISSPEGGDRIVYHDNLKTCALPSGTEATHYPIPEAEGTAILFENDLTNAEGEKEAPPPEQLVLQG